MKVRPIVSREAVVPDALAGHVPPLLARLYAARGVRAAAELDTSLSRLVPVGAFAALPAAVERLRRARRDGERIVIVGDYDADGATSTALLMRVLPVLGFGAVDFVIPNRFDYGYGLSPEAVTLAARAAPDLIVTVDNGISSHAGVDAARERGIDVLVTDHHLPGDTLPAACALVNPNIAGEPFPHKSLAGVGVVFYLLAALLRALVDDGEVDAGAQSHLTAALDLVALGTVADVVPLDHNNRILVEQGLRRIRAGHASPGVHALLAVAGREPARATAADLGFAAGPRLNAAGRLDDMTVGIRCLLASDHAEAMRLASGLDALNRERRTLEARMRDEAEAHVARLAADEYPLPAGLTLYREDWHQGVVGLVASRMRERHHRPVFAFAPGDGGMLKGSGRSVPGLHLRDALDRVAVTHPGLVAKFGGHAMAAGLSLDATRLQTFRDAFAAEAERWLSPEVLAGTLCTDGALDPEALDLDTAELLRDAGPWGQHFDEPLFHGEFRVHEAREVGRGHLKMTLSPADAPRPVPAIAFGWPEPWPDTGARLVVVYRLQVNEWQGRRSVQLLVEHLQPA